MNVVSTFPWETLIAAVGPVLVVVVNLIFSVINRKHASLEKQVEFFNNERRKIISRIYAKMNEAYLNCVKSSDEIEFAKSLNQLISILEIETTTSSIFLGFAGYEIYNSFVKELSQLEKDFSSKRVSFDMLSSEESQENQEIIFIARQDLLVKKIDELVDLRSLLTQDTILYLEGKPAKHKSKEFRKHEYNFI